MDFVEDIKHFVPSDLLTLLLSGMEHLFKKNKENTIYHLCKCLAEMCDKSSAHLCVDRMPFGFIAYNCKFFPSNDASNLHAPEDYKNG